MPLWLILVLVGIVLAILVNYALGIVVIVIGLAVLLVPYLGGRGPTTRV